MLNNINNHPRGAFGYPQPNFPTINPNFGYPQPGLNMIPPPSPMYGMVRNSMGQLIQLVNYGQANKRISDITQ